MQSVVRHAQDQDEAMRIIEDWLKDKGIDPEEMRDGGGVSLEELEYGNDIVALLCERIENLSA